MYEPRTQLLALAALCLLSVAASCDKGGKPAAPASSAAHSGERIERLPGIDVSELTDAEVELWVGLVNDQLSPCGDPLSVARCVSEKHKCGACTTAARYLTRLVMEGYDRATIEEHYRGRFSPSAKVDLDLEGAHVRGAPMAPITIVEFSDFQCPYCGAAHPELSRMLRELDGQVKLVFKHFPLSAHTRALYAARAAEAAAKQGKFWEMHDVLFEHQRELEDADLQRYAQMIGLDMDRFAADVAAPETEQRVLKDRKEGEAFKLEGTPSIFVNGRLLREPLKALAAYVQEELEL